MSIFITSTGFYHPSEKITNRDLERIVDTSDQWIVEKTGIRERRKAGPNQTTPDLGVLAAQDALKRRGISKEDIDLLVCTTSTPEKLIPSTACQIGQILGINPLAFDVSAACSGFLFGLRVVKDLLLNDSFDKALLVTPEKYTRVTDYSDRRTCFFWGDGAGACVVEKKPNNSGALLIDISLGNDNSKSDLIHIPVNGNFWQDGPAVKPHAISRFTESAKHILRQNGLDAEAIDLFIGHQANFRLLEEVCRQLGISKEKHWSNVEYYGNQGAAGVITALAQADHQGIMKDGDNVLLTVFGSGFAWGSALLRWINKKNTSASI